MATERPSAGELARSWVDDLFSREPSVLAEALRAGRFVRITMIFSGVVEFRASARIEFLDAGTVTVAGEPAHCYVARGVVAFERSPDRKYEGPGVTIDEEDGIGFCVREGYWRDEVARRVAAAATLAAIINNMPIIRERLVEILLPVAEDVVRAGGE